MNVPRWAFLTPLAILPPLAFLIYLVLGANAQPDLNNYGHAPAIGGDFLQYWSAGWLVLQGQVAGVYQAEVIQAVMTNISAAPRRMLPLVYPPHALFLFTPFALLPYYAGFLAFTAAGLMALLGAVGMVLRHRVYGLAAAGCGLVWLCCLYGQTGLFIAALNGLGFVLLQRWPVAAGGVVALLTIKPHVGLLWPLVLLLERRWKVLASTIASLAIMVALCMALFGQSIWGQFFDALGVISGSVETHLLAWQHQCSLYALLRVMDVGHLPALASQLALAGVVVMLFVVSWRRTNGNPVWQLALFGSATLLLSPYAHNYDMVLLIWPVLALLTLPATGRWMWLERVALLLAFVFPLFVFFLRVPVGLFLNLLIFLLILRRLHAESSLLAPAPLR